MILDQIRVMASIEVATPTESPRFAIHPAWVRITHWINALVLLVLLMSGLQIFNAHPALYWGNFSDFDAPILSMSAAETMQGEDVGITTIFGHPFMTTGVLGLSRDDQGNPRERGFPAWATLPSFQALALGRRWHFFFAWIFVVNGVLYVAAAILARHFWRDLVPSRGQLRHIGRTILDHLRLRFPRGEEARRYNVLQKLSYLFVPFVLGPLIVLAGLAMSPRIDAGFPWLPVVFGGRQSARTIHFLCAFAFLAFVIVHIVMVLLSGVWNNLRSMITGWYDLGRAAGGDD